MRTVVTAMMLDYRTKASIRIGALAPLSPPGWVEAGRHLLAGLQLGADEINAGGGIDGKPIELIVRDTAADPAKELLQHIQGLGLTQTKLAMP